jgi:hypothetical protein
VNVLHGTRRKPLFALVVQQGLDMLSGEMLELDLAQGWGNMVFQEP